jgi:anti-sigma B factor antagonist
MLITASVDTLPGGIAVVKVSGPMTLGSSLKMVESQIHSTIAAGASKIALDLAAVDYVDSAGLGLMVHLFGMLSEQGGTLRLSGVAPRVMTLLTLTKTDTVLTIDPDVHASLDALRVLA